MIDRKQFSHRLIIAVAGTLMVLAVFSWSPVTEAKCSVYVEIKCGEQKQQ